MSIKFYLVFFLLLSQLYGFALLPSKYTSSEYKLSAQVKTQVCKTFEAIDKFDKVELGNLVGTALVFDYDDKGNINKIREYTKEGALDLAYILEYDTQGFLESEKQYGQNDQLIRYGLFTYKNGKKIEEKIYTSEGTYAYSEVYMYDTRGVLIEKRRKNADDFYSYFMVYQ
ncbi:MAG: hypothetical protein RR328_03835 [Bacteroidales bacterium]